MTVAATRFDTVIDDLRVRRREIADLNARCGVADATDEDRSFTLKALADRLDHPDGLRTQRLRAIALISIQMLEGETR